jgi:uncharacterized protein
LILYLDTSALVKLYVREATSGKTRTLVDRAKAVATSVVTYAEARATFARLLRNKSSSDRRHRERIDKLNLDWDKLLRVELSPALVRLSGEMAEIYDLRGFDAIHLASALWLRDQSPAALSFVAFDQSLVEAAKRSGLPLAP